MATRNVVLAETQPELVDRLVASGRYQNVSEALPTRLHLKGSSRHGQISKLPMSLKSFVFVISLATALPAFAQEMPLSVELADIERQLTEIETHADSNDNGLIQTLINARREALLLARTLIQNRMNAEAGGAIVEVTVPAAQPDDALAAQILGEMAPILQFIEEAEHEAATGGGLVQAFALNRAETARLTLVQLQMGYLQAKYGVAFPALQPLPAASEALDVPITETEGSLEDDTISAIAGAFGLALGSSLEPAADATLMLSGYQTTNFLGKDSSEIFSSFFAAVTPTTKLVASVAAFSDGSESRAWCQSTTEQLSRTLSIKYGEPLGNVISVEAFRAGDLFMWKDSGRTIELACRSFGLNRPFFVQIYYTDEELMQQFVSENLATERGQFNLDDM